MGSLGYRQSIMVPETTEPMKSVLLIDDHPVVAVGLSLALQGSRDFRLVATASAPADGLAQVDLYRPDALVLDLVFAGLLQTSLVSKCRAALPNAAIIVFSSLPETLYGRQTMTSGANAYLNKSADMSVLVQLMINVVARPATRAISVNRLDSDGEGHPQRIFDGVHLTRREIEIARYVGRGLSVDEIALTLGISANTASAHRDNLRKKLDCRDTKDLIARLARIGGLADDSI